MAQARNPYWGIQHYMIYQKLRADERVEAKGKPIRYIASNQLERVAPGDILWLVNVYRRHLFLIGRLQVEYIIDDTEVAQVLVDSESPDWQDADWYAIAGQYHAEAVRFYDITLQAGEIRFIGDTEKLSTEDGVEPRQLFRLRQLATESGQVFNDIWYGDVFRPQTATDFIEFLEDETSYQEGQTVVRTMEQRRRSQQLVRRAKERHLAQNGRLLCEVCGFDFNHQYGVDYIEAHHTDPIASSMEGRETTMNDLHMLCANCHRVAHLRTPPYTLAELKHMLSRQTATERDTA